MKAAGLLPFLILPLLGNAQSSYRIDPTTGIPNIPDDKVWEVLRQLPIPGEMQPYMLQKAFVECDAEMMGHILLAKINAYRATYDLAPLTEHDGGSKVAREYAELLAKANELDHRYQGTTPTTRVKAAFPDGASAAENLMSTSGGFHGQLVVHFIDHVMSVWIKSNGHHRLLLSPGKLAAVGVYRDYENEEAMNYTVAAFNIIYPWKYP